MPLLKNFTGINNVVEPEFARDGDLYTCDNVYIDDAGRIIMRPGFATLEETRPIHSGFSDGTDILYVCDDSLCRVIDYQTNEYPYEVLASGLPIDTPMSYLSLDGITYCGNGLQSYVIPSGGSIRPWGTTVPAQPVLTPHSTVVGTLPAGTYAVTLTYVRSDGSESGASEPVEIEIGSEGGFLISEIPASTDSFVVGVAVYVTNKDGETLPYGAGMNLVTAQSTYDDVDVTEEPDRAGRSCKTLGLYPLPAGQCMCFYRGRMFIANGSTIWWSRPWAYELCELDAAHASVDGTITNLIPVETGIWVTTDTGSYFLSGRNPNDEGGFQIKTRTVNPGARGGVEVDGAYLGVRGVNPGKLAMWVSSAGVCVGDSAGTAVNMTDPVWRPGSTEDGSGSLITINGTRLYVFSVDGVTYFMNLSNKAITTFDIEAYGLFPYGEYIYACGENGLCEFSGVSDNGDPIPIEIEKKDITFGSRKLKRITDAFIRGQIDGDFTVEVSGNGYTSIVSASGAGPTGRSTKVNLPRGVSGESIGLKISASDGEYMSITNIDLNVETSSARRGRTGRA